MRNAALRHLLPLCLLAGTALPTGAVPVDLELVLLIDVSGSVDPGEFLLQRTGYVNAFNDPAVVAAIQSGPVGSIAATVVYWQGPVSVQLEDNGPFLEFDSIQQKVAWTQLSDATSASAFAAQIAGTTAMIEIDLGGGQFIETGDIDDPLRGSGFTGVRRALLFGRDLLLTANGFEGSRSLIDISGDGFENVDHNPLGCSDPSGCTPGHLNDFLINNAALHFAATAAARDLVLGSGISINALPILTDFPDLDTFFYDAYVVGGPGAFSLAANDFDDLDAAVRAKLIAEVVPEPGTLGLLSLGLAGAVAARQARSARAARAACEGRSATAVAAKAGVSGR